MQVPTRSQERLVRPLPLIVHDWRLTGIDFNRGLSAADVAGRSFSARAARRAGLTGVP